MICLADSNILLRLSQKNNPHYPSARNAVIELRRQGDEICIVPQNLIEFWSVATRLAVYNGLGLTAGETTLEIRKFKRLFKFYDDEPGVFAEWENLVVKYQVSGKNVHDARLVAAMIKHKIPRLLTFNVKDFNRYIEITVIDPQNI
jgi:predicted nucleic acid-binding protein